VFHQRIAYVRGRDDVLEEGDAAMDAETEDIERVLLLLVEAFEKSVQVISLRVHICIHTYIRMYMLVGVRCFSL
jgi:hypothetical protein